MTYFKPALKEWPCFWSSQARGRGWGPSAKVPGKSKLTEFLGGSEVGPTFRPVKLAKDCITEFRVQDKNTSIFWNLLWFVYSFYLWLYPTYC